MRVTCHSMISLFAASVLGSVLSGCTMCNENKSESAPTGSSVAAAPTIQPGAEVTELGIVDVTIGTGVEAVDGKKVTVHYTGTLTNGSKFDSSRDRDQPFVFELGAGQVIQGWDQGFKGMKVGGQRKLTIPAAMGYGSQGMGGVIPPNSVLLFDVELLKVE